ncbi:YhzD-like protein [Psychrobacillus insolitus]|uniref:YhzD-like protein n=1 Tax=Psychrobacillus insolitus TaxID=1461 RepID=A0A2W7MQN1_9BACI|nr:YhzD family protein [Psychrobacillus insolitus]PZX04954.1 YhzD-like protein [Psychrobacillus insolitus]
MKSYKFTAFEPTGKVITEETWTYENDDEAKVKGELAIEEKGLTGITHRLVNSSGKLVLFHV